MCFFFSFLCQYVEFFLIQMKGLWTEDVFHCTECKADCGNVIFSIKILDPLGVFFVLFFPHMLSPNFIKAMTMKEKSLNVKTYLSINLSLIRLIKTALQFIKRKEHFHWAQSLYKVRKKTNQNIITVRNSRMNAH